MVAHRLFEWDDAKADANLAKHRVEFAYATRVFLDPARADWGVSRQGDGEARSKTVGQIEGRLFSVVYTVRGDVTRLISARRANTTESRFHGSFRS